MRCSKSVTGSPFLFFSRTILVLPTRPIYYNEINPLSTRRRRKKKKTPKMLPKLPALISRIVSD